MKLALVDPDIGTLEFIAKRFTAAGHGVVKVSDPASILSHARNSSFDFILFSEKAIKTIKPSYVEQFFASYFNKVKVAWYKVPFDIDRLITETEKKAKEKRVFDILLYSDIKMFVLRNGVTRDGVKVNLTQKQFNLLDYFMRRPETIITYSSISKDLFTGQGVNEITIDKNMQGLKHALEGRSHGSYLHRIPEIGWVMRSDKSQSLGRRIGSNI